MLTGQIVSYIAPLKVIYKIQFELFDTINIFLDTFQTGVREEKKPSAHDLGGSRLMARQKHQREFPFETAFLFLSYLP